MQNPTAAPLSPLHLAHLEADHRLAAGDTSDLLPGIDPARAVVTAARILASDYHDGCPICAAVEATAESLGCLLDVCSAYGRHDEPHWAGWTL